MRKIIIPMLLSLSACAVDFPLIPVTNYVPPASELARHKCKKLVGVSDVKFNDARDKSLKVSESSFIYAEDGLLETIKKAGMYRENSPINISADFKSLKQSEKEGFFGTSTPTAAVDYTLLNKRTGESQKISFTTECRNESYAATLNTFSDLFACTLRKNYAQLITTLSKPASDNLACK
jgi:hypothetical protein